MPKIPPDQLAKSMGRSVSELMLLLQSLYPSGFPRASSEDGTFDTLKILAWVVAQQELQLDLVTAMNDATQDHTD